jgi:hypothetical protein
VTTVVMAPGPAMRGMASGASSQSAADCGSPSSCCTLVGEPWSISRVHAVSRPLSKGKKSRTGKFSSTIRIYPAAYVLAFSVRNDGLGKLPGFNALCMESRRSWGLPHR